MSLKEQVKQILKSLTGLSFYKSLPFGVDPFQDIKQRMKGYDFRIFLDVGANIGQTAKQIRASFPKAIIHSIEPVKNTFVQLQQNTKGDNIFLHNIALGARNETIEVNIDEANTNSSINSLLKENNEMTSGKIRIEAIQVITGNDFCKKQNIDHIDYLKIDTEGYDLEVLKGVSELLEGNAIGFIEAEVSMNPNNTFHVSFEDIKAYLEKYNYLVFGMYEQVQEWKIKSPVLRRCNVLFISEKLIKKYTT